MNRIEDTMEDAIETPEGFIFCGACGSGGIAELGQLGRYQWFRCEDCGAEQYLDESEDSAT